MLTLERLTEIEIAMRADAGFRFRDGELEQIMRIVRASIMPVDANGCYTEENGECVSLGPCIHKDFDGLAQRMRDSASGWNQRGSSQQQEALKEILLQEGAAAIAFLTRLTPTPEQSKERG